jgi:NTE family protein
VDFIYERNTILKVGLSLGGGGAHGYAHIGIIQALIEAGIKVDVINGTSIGAIIGGAYALYSDLDQVMSLIEEVLATIKVRNFNLFRFSSQMSHTVLRNWLGSAMGNVANLSSGILNHNSSSQALQIIFRDQQFTDTRIPFSAVATDLVTWQTVVIKEGKLTDGILPSIAIPGVFHAIHRGRQILVDGGVLANVPVSQLRQVGADFVIAVRLPWKIASDYQNGFDLLNRVELMKQNIMEQWQVDSADCTIEIDLPAFDILNFEDFKPAIALGYETTTKELPRLKKGLGKYHD